MTACFYSIYCNLIHNGDATTQNWNSYVTVLYGNFLQKRKSLKYMATNTVVFVASLVDVAVSILLL
jgi:hypothetical protein